MAITVNHGSISSVLGLAQAAGVAQATQQNNAQAVAYAQLIQRAREAQAQREAQQIQMALGVQEHNVLNQMTADQRGTENALATRHLDATIQSRQADDQRQQAALEETIRNNAAGRGIQQQNADTASFQADNTAGVQAFKAQQLEERKNAAMQFIQQQTGGDPAKTAAALQFFNATGRVPEDIAPQAPLRTRPSNSTDLDRDPSVQIAKQDAIAMKDAATRAAKARQAYLKDTLLGFDPGAGKDPTYEALKAAEAQAVQGYDASLASIRKAMQTAAQGVPALTGSQGARPSSNALPVVDTKAEYDELPSGTQYVDAQDGKTYTKR